MIPEEYRLPLMEFREKANKIPNLISIIIFGSMVRNELSPKSDIDLLLVFETDHNPELGEEAKIAHKVAMEISIKYDLIHPFSLIFLNQQTIEDTEPDFLWNVAREGILLWGKPSQAIYRVPPSSLEPFLLVKYSTINLKPREKRKLLRKLYTAKKKLMDKDKERLGPGVLLTPANKYEKLKELLDSFQVRYSVKKIWSH